MTCIVGLEHDGRVLIGGDVQGTGRNNKVVHTQPKVFNRTGIIFGYTTSYRFGQILECGIQDPVVPDKENDIYRWLINVLIPDIRANLKSSGFEGGGSCLIGIKSQLWELQPDFSVLRSVRGYAAVGSGCEYAMGSMMSICAEFPKTRNDAERAISRSIEAAGTFSPSVGIESRIIST